MVRFNLWPWSNSLRIWKAALTKERMTFSEKAEDNGIDYLNNEVCDCITSICRKKKIDDKGLNFREIDIKINGIIFQHLKEFYDGGVADFETYLINVFFYYFGKANNDLMQDEFSHFKKLFDDMKDEFRKGIQLAKKSKDKKKILLRELLKSEYLN
jgi:hypothetical protein